jgi:hypothetical protein
MPDDLREAMEDAIAAPASAPVLWIRWRSDGGYEGPIMDANIEEVRKRSGAWTPLYAGIAPVAAEPEPHDDFLLGAQEHADPSKWTSREEWERAHARAADSAELPTPWSQEALALLADKLDTIADLLRRERLGECSAGVCIEAANLIRLVKTNDIGHPAGSSKVAEKPSGSGRGD